LYYKGRFFGSLTQEKEMYSAVYLIPLVLVAISVYVVVSLTLLNRSAEKKGSGDLSWGNIPENYTSDNIHKGSSYPILVTDKESGQHVVHQHIYVLEKSGRAFRIGVFPFGEAFNQGVPAFSGWATEVKSRGQLRRSDLLPNCPN
jgi:hypothetical protein